MQLSFLKYSLKIKRNETINRSANFIWRKFQKARELVKIGKASNLKEAWAIIKAENEASKEVPAEPIAQVFYNGLW